MVKWIKEEEQYMLDLIKQYNAAEENNRGLIYVRHKNPDGHTIANELNSVYNNGRTNHSVRKRVQKLEIPADVFFGRSVRSNKPDVKQQILDEIYNVVDCKKFIKIQSLIKSL